MINAKAISAQHPKNVGETFRIIKGRPNALEKARRVV
jgi:hypothetical protein